MSHLKAAKLNEQSFLSAYKDSFIMQVIFHYSLFLINHYL